MQKIRIPKLFPIEAINTFYEKKSLTPWPLLIHKGFAKFLNLCLPLTML
jgi:hypothetical protein